MPNHSFNPTPCRSLPAVDSLCSHGSLRSSGAG